MDLREVDGKLPFAVQDGLPQQVKSVNEDSGELIRTLKQRNCKGKG